MRGITRLYKTDNSKHARSVVAGYDASRSNNNMNHDPKSRPSRKELRMNTLGGFVPDDFPLPSISSNTRPDEILRNGNY